MWGTEIHTPAELSCQQNVMIGPMSNFLILTCLLGILIKLSSNDNYSKTMLWTPSCLMGTHISFLWHMEYSLLFFLPLLLDFAVYVLQDCSTQVYSPQFSFYYLWCVSAMFLTTSRLPNRHCITMEIRHSDLSIHSFQFPILWKV